MTYLITTTVQFTLEDTSPERALVRARYGLDGFLRENGHTPSTGGRVVIDDILNLDDAPK